MLSGDKNWIDWDETFEIIKRPKLPVCIEEFSTPLHDTERAEMRYLSRPVEESHLTGRNHATRFRSTVESGIFSVCATPILSSSGWTIEIHENKNRKRIENDSTFLFPFLTNEWVV